QRSLAMYERRRRASVARGQSFRGVRRAACDERRRAIGAGLKSAATLLNNGTTSDAVLKLLVDQTLAELKSKSSVSLDMVRDWSFAERAKRELEKNRGGLG